MKGSGVYKWSTIDRVVTTFITMSGNIVMARMLDVHDFSLLAMVGIFTAVAENLSSCGMSDWLIREPKPTSDDYSTAFVFNSSLGFIFGVIFFFCGGFLGDWFEEPALDPIMKAIGVCLFLGTMSFVQETRLRKLLEIKKIAIVKILSALCAVGLGIVLACLDCGYWALVSCRVFLSAFVFIFYVLVSHWFPALRFSIKSFKAMFGYGINLLLSYVCLQIGQNINAFVLGKVNANASGLYSQAQKMEDVPFNIINTAISIPFLAVVSNEEDKQSQSRLIREMGVNMLFVNFAILLLLFAVAPSAFNTLFGSKWDGAVPIFKVLLGFGFFMNVKNYITTVLKFYSATRQIRNITIIEVTIQLLFLVVAFKYGVLWIAASQLFAALIVLIPYCMLYSKYENGGLVQMMKEFARSSFAPLIAFAITILGQLMWSGILPAVVDLALSSFVFGISLFVICDKVNQPVYKRIISAIKKK